MQNNWCFDPAGAESTNRVSFIFFIFKRNIVFITLHLQCILGRWLSTFLQKKWLSTHFTLTTKSDWSSQPSQQCLGEWYQGVQAWWEPQELWEWRWKSHSPETIHFIHWSFSAHKNVTRYAVGVLTIELGPVRNYVGLYFLNCTVKSNDNDNYLPWDYLGRLETFLRSTWDLMIFSVP